MHKYYGATQLIDHAINAQEAFIPNHRDADQGFGPYGWCNAAGGRGQDSVLYQDPDV